jgi:tight adherence protein B
MKLKIRALSSEARASAYILGILPFAMFALIRVVNPEYGGVLLEDPRGHVMLAAAGVILAIGFGIMTKMVRFEI